MFISISISTISIYIPKLLDLFSSSSSSYYFKNLLHIKINLYIDIKLSCRSTTAIKDDPFGIHIKLSGKWQNWKKYVGDYISANCLS